MEEELGNIWWHAFFSSQVPCCWWFERVNAGWINHYQSCSDVVITGMMGHGTIVELCIWWYLVMDKMEGRCKLLRMCGEEYVSLCPTRFARDKGQGPLNFFFGEAFTWDVPKDAQGSKGGFSENRGTQKNCWLSMVVKVVMVYHHVFILFPVRIAAISSKLL